MPARVGSVLRADRLGKTICQTCARDTRRHPADAMVAVMPGPDPHAADPVTSPSDPPSRPAADADAPTPPAPEPAGALPDVGRRQFFQRLAGDLINTASALTGVASVAQGALEGVAVATRELETDAQGRRGISAAGRAAARTASMER